MDELRLTGNCMKGSRPLLSFDESFDRLGHLKLLKELFEETFGVPRGHPKSKPFIDRIMSFYYADKRVGLTLLSCLSGLLLFMCL
jgi:ribosome biogenesis protein BRX1